MKHFKQWFGLKETLHEKTHKPPYVSEGDIWWCSLGENVGSEINGKSGKFSRPAIVLKKLAHGFYFVIPTTSQDKDGSWYVPVRHKGNIMTACLQQARSLDHRRLWSKLGTLDDEDFTISINKYSPPKWGRGKIPNVS
jgi:mRNA interferase MazF